MTQASLSSHPPAATLRRALATLAQRRQAMAWRARGLRGAWLGGAGLLAVLVADAAVVLPASVRFALLMAMIAAVLTLAAARTRRPRALSDVERRRLAGELERRQGLPHNRLVNALDLAEGAAAGDDPLTRELARRGVARGEAAMQTVGREAAVDGAAAQREAARLWAVAVAWAVVTLVQPGLVGQGMARLVLPWADVPAFSLTRLAVSVEPERPTMGDDVQVMVTVRGAAPDAPPRVVAARAVRRDAHDRRQWTMRSAGDRRWVHTFHGLREPVRFRVEAGSAWTRAFVLQPGEPERERPDVASEADRSPAEEEPAVAVNDEPAPGAERAGDADAALAEQVASLHALMQQAAALRDLADALAEASALDSATAQAMMEALHEELTSFAGDAAGLAQAVEAAAGEVDEPLRAELLALAASLQELALPELTAAADATATDLAPGPVREAAEADRAALAEQGAGLADRLDGTVSRAGEPAAALPWADPAAAGTYDITMAPRDGEAPAAFRAMTDQAPPAYRELVDRYFRSLNEEIAR